MLSFIIYHFNNYVIILYHFTNMYLKLKILQLLLVFIIDIYLIKHQNDVNIIS